MAKITFPDKAVGRLMNRAATEPEFIDAQGTVELDDAGTWMLELTDCGAATQAAIADFPVDLLKAVSTQSAEPGVGAALARLTGLTQVMLSGEITDDDVRAVATLPELSACSFNTDSPFGEGLAALAGKTVQLVIVGGTGLSDAGLRALVAIDSKYIQLSFGRDLGAAECSALAGLKTEHFVVIAPDVDGPALAKTLADSPAVTAVTVHRTAKGEDEPAFDAETAAWLRGARPDLAVNGVWYAPDVAASTAVVEDAPSSPVELTEANFDEMINGPLPVLVDFWAEWCGPCKRIAPIVEQLAAELSGRLIVGKLDVDNYKPISDRYGILGIPALLVFRDGKQIAKIGSQTAEGIREQLAPVLG